MFVLHLLHLHLHSVLHAHLRLRARSCGGLQSLNALLSLLLRLHRLHLPIKTKGGGLLLEVPLGSLALVASGFIRLAQLGSSGGRFENGSGFLQLG